MGSETKLFTMKITPEARALALQALAAEAVDYADYDHLQEVVSSSMNRLQLEAGEAAVLSAALMDYAEGQLREGSDARRVATEFAYALGDVAVTADEATTLATRELQEIVDDVARADEAIARSDRAFRERMDRRRDENLREVFTGGPRYKMNIWTGKPELVDDSGARGRTPASRQSNRVRTLEGVVHSNCPPVRAIADEESSEVLAGAEPLIDHNAQMKVEGAEQLILDRNRGITSYKS